VLKADTFSATGLVDAWKLVAAKVASATPPSYLTTVSFGTAFNVNLANVRLLDNAAASIGAERPSSVASMLMPFAVFTSAAPTANAVDGALRTFGRGRRKKLQFSQWTNTYFERLAGAWYDKVLQRHDLKSANLLKMIDNMNAWKGNIKSAFYLHTSLDKDNFRKLGSPCLQYIQFSLTEGAGLEIVALYRAHDYFHKFLGNAVGLQRLGEFVASRTGRSLRGVSIISLNPFTQSSKAALKNYVASV
jgi:hypothetical protein